MVVAFALSLGLFFYLPLILTDLLGIEGSLWFASLCQHARTTLAGRWLLA